MYVNLLTLEHENGMIQVLISLLVVWLITTYILIAQLFFTDMLEDLGKLKVVLCLIRLALEWKMAFGSFLNIYKSSLTFRSPPPLTSIQKLAVRLVQINVQKVQKNHPPLNPPPSSEEVLILMAMKSKGGTPGNRIFFLNKATESGLGAGGQGPPKITRPSYKPKSKISKSGPRCSDYSHLGQGISSHNWTSLS